MTALDQAIIKAYLRQGGLPDGDEIEVANPVRLDVPPEDTVREPKKAELCRSSSQRGPIGLVWPASVPLDALEFSGAGLPTGVSLAIESCAPSQIAGGETQSSVKDGVCGDIPPKGFDDDKAQVGVFEPVWRIDAVSWPRPSRRLRKVASKQIERLADAVRNKAAMGARLIGVAGCCQGEGCTTVILAVAMRLVELGMKTLLLDGDVLAPNLPERLALANEMGWRDVVLGSISLEDAVTQSESECVALLPYCGQATPMDGPEPSEQAVATFLGRVRAHYDIVLADLGGTLGVSDGDGSLAGKLAERIDSVLTVYNVRTTSRFQLETLRQRFRQLGIEETGIIENFVDGG